MLPDKTIKLWYRNGELRRSLENHDGRVFDIKFSPDGKTIATASQYEVKIWNFKGKEIDSFSKHKSRLV